MDALIRSDTPAITVVWSMSGYGSGSSSETTEIPTATPTGASSPTPALTRVSRRDRRRVATSPAMPVTNNNGPKNKMGDAKEKPTIADGPSGRGPTR